MILSRTPHLCILGGVMLGLVALFPALGFSQTPPSGGTNALKVVPTPITSNMAQPGNVAGMASDRVSFMHGMSYCSYWNSDYLNEYSPRSLARIKETGNDWVSILATWYQANETSTAIAADAQKSPSDAAVKKAIADAKALGLKVALKPHVDLLNGKWRGDIGKGIPDAQFDAFFAAWSTSYQQFMDHFIAIAVEQKVDMVFIGTEYVEIMERGDGRTLPAWTAYINRIRSVYPGKLTYCADRAHWPDLAAVQKKTWFRPFWQSLDYIGIDAYYTLGSDSAPSVEQLMTAWQGAAQILEALHTTYGKPVLFTEIGYRSIEQCHINPWDYSVDRPISEESQRRCYEAFYKTLGAKPWAAGVFLWSWSPFLKSDITNPSAPEWLKSKLAEYQKGYTPEGKSAETILRQANSANQAQWLAR